MNPSRRLQNENVHSCFSDKRIFLLIFVGSFLLFFLSPVQRMGDSKYCLLVSQSILEHRTFDISDYSLFNPGGQAPIFTNPISAKKGLPYQLEYHRKRLYYFFPPGTSILSVPFVALFIPFHKTPAEEGIYSEKNERHLQIIIGSVLMAALAGLLYLAARIMLNRSDSILLMLAGALGTMVWSTASRGLPSHSWGILLLTIIVYLLLRERRNGTSGHLNEIVLATLLSWTYFIRPTFALSIVGISVYYTYVKRRIPVAYVVTGAFWLILFLLYSNSLYDQSLPNYYLPGRVNFSFDWTFWTALAGVLISPSRGLLIFVPTVIACAYLSLRYRHFLPHKPLAWLAVTVILLHAILIASFRQWWGGYSYGPRLLTDILPWFFLLGILSIKAREDAMLSGSTTLRRHRVESCLISVLLLASLCLHGIGAWSDAAWKWNIHPTDIDTDSGRLWDWKHPQFLGASKDSVQQ